MIQLLSMFQVHFNWSVEIPILETFIIMDIN